MVDIRARTVILGTELLHRDMNAQMPSDQMPDYQKYGRRLSDKLLLAFDRACETHELEIAIQLLTLVERLAAKEAEVSEPTRRKAIEGLVKAHERLWTLRSKAPAAA